MVVAELEEDERRPPGGIGILRRRGAVGGRQPGEAGDVAGRVLDVLAQDDAAVGARRRRGAERCGRMCRSPSPVDPPDRLRSAADRLDRGARQVLTEKARALGAPLGMREDGLDRSELDLRAGDQHLVDVVVELADDPDPLGVERQRVEGRSHRPLDRVLERDQGPLGVAALDRLDGGVDGRHRAPARSPPPRRRGAGPPRRRCPAGPRNATRSGDAGRSGVIVIRPDRSGSGRDAPAPWRRAPRARGRGWSARRRSAWRRPGPDRVAGSPR